jgi:phospholipid-binding lipoprotein MlaA
MSKLRTIALTVAASAVLTGCATGPNPADPYEGYNRAMFNFNDKVDTYALKPVATVYKNVTPNFVQTGVGNFFANLAEGDKIARTQSAAVLEDLINQFIYSKAAEGKD